MKRERLLHILGLLEDELLAEAEDNIPKPQKHRQRWQRWLPAAACLLLILGVALWYRAMQSPPALFPQESSGVPGTEDDLPLLTLDTDWSGAMGFEGYMAYDISDLVNANPWSEDAELKTLPVYRNVNSYDKAGRVSEPNLKAMEQILLEAAKSLGMDTHQLEVTTDYPGEEQLKKITEKYAAIGEEVPPETFKIGRLFLQDHQYQLEVDADGTVKVEFEPLVRLPAEYDFSNYASYEQVGKVGEYLREAYKSFIHMKAPAVNISGGDYDINARQSYSLGFYEGTGSLEEQILSYHFEPTVFYGDDEGNLWLARRYHTDLSQKLGDYPIITAPKARELLAKGHYITTVPEAFPGEEYIRKTELVYRTGTVQTYMPYYRIYVELPHMKMDNGLKTYGAYYVPAVQERYLSNMPLWDGSFD